ncbi:pyridine nucleotide-disulfide oxidoreductase domain-containing protein 2 [Quercus suber]|uniref:Pyridine nucleotide-disulfide oxidoreductase domain-containing protein 2 n=1 Tax=Quercus suber TaxID=58331 RepID=A0AAW0IJI2_QUESU
MWRRSFSSSSATATSALKDKKWDALVIGGGHNGLTSAAYLARAGLSVAVLERRHVIGGAAVTEELIPGFKFSRCSYLQSLLRPSIIRELELRRHGLKLLKRSPSSFTPCLDGRYLLLGPDKDLNHSEISKFSKQDADAYPRIVSRMEYKNHRFGLIVCGRLSTWAKRIWDFMDLLLSPASKVLNNWFETDVLKATLATDAVIGTTGSVHTPGSGYVLLHHVMGETDGDRGIWSYVEGGMGSVSLAISNAAKEAGAHIVTSAEVSQLLVEDSGAVNGVLLADGTPVHSSVVLSNATPYKTYMDLVPRSVLPDDFIRAIKYSDYSSATTKINLAVDKLPQFQCCKIGHPDAGPQHVGTIHIGSESMEEIHSACQDSANGIPSRRLVIEMTIPSVLDKTISPPGKHVINLFIQYTPYNPSDGSWGDPAYRESFAQKCFALIDEYAPAFSSSVIGYDMLTPPDLEREIGLTGLYLCGSGAHPGGGVMGAPGRNAAQLVLKDVNKS